MKDKYVAKKYKDLDIAYMAGIVDGEGSLTTGTYSQGPKGTPWYTTYLSICNTEEPLIDWLVNTFGARKWEYTPNQTPKNSRKKVFRWQITGDRLLHVCQLIYPFSVIKKRQIEIVIEMLNTRKKGLYKVGQCGPRVLQEVTDKRATLAGELKSLHNRRGS